MRKTANLYRILEKKLLQTCPHGRPRRKLENNIKIDLEEITSIRIGCNWLSSVELLESANILLAYRISVAHNALQIQNICSFEITRSDMELHAAQSFIRN